MKTASCIAIGALLLASCESTGTIYHWGTYETSVRHVLLEPDRTDVSQEIRALSSEVERDRIEGRRAAPGVHAHLGYLYFITGNPDSAKTEFETEKSLYPESAVFIDGVLRRMKS